MMKRMITGCIWLVVILFLVCITLDSHAQNINKPINTGGVTGLNLTGLNTQSSRQMLVNLKTFKGFYLVAERGGGGSVLANSRQVGASETFTLIDVNGGNLVSGDKVQIRASNKKHYLVAEKGGGDVVKADRTQPRQWETFTIRKVQGQGEIGSGDKISLQAYNGKYVVAEQGGGGKVNANRSRVGAWETFTLVLKNSDVGGSPPAVVILNPNLLPKPYSVKFQTATNHFVVAEHGGGGAVKADSQQAGASETFTLIDVNGGNLVSGDKVQIRASNKKHYLVAEKGGGDVVKADRTQPRQWETFTIRKVQGQGEIGSGDKISLQAYNGKYVVAEQGGGGKVNANRSQVGAWETFTLMFADTQMQQRPSEQPNHPQEPIATIHTHSPDDSQPTPAVIPPQFNRTAFKKAMGEIKKRTFITPQALQNITVQTAVASEDDLATLSPIEDPVFNVVRYTSEYAEVGSGFDSLNSVVHPQSALKPLGQAKIQNGGTSLKSVCEYVQSLDEYEEKLGFAMSVSGGFGPFSASSNFGFKESQDINKFYEHFVAHSSYRTLLKYGGNSPLELAEEAKQILKDQGREGFFRKYGDCFIYAIQYGAGMRGRASFQKQLAKEESEYTLDASTGLFILKADTKTDSSYRQKHEDEKISVFFEEFGTHRDRNPLSISDLKSLYAQFPGVAMSTANSTGSGGVIYYTVVKYSSLPDFDKVAGAENQMNLQTARMMLQELSWHYRKLLRMINNLTFVITNKEQFKPEDVSKSHQTLLAAETLKSKLENDIRKVQLNPFASQWGINIMQYRQMPQFAPSTMLVEVTVDIPGRPARMSNTGHWDLWKGPLIGDWSVSKGNDELDSDEGGINVYIDSQLTIAGNSSTVKLAQEFSVYASNIHLTTIGGNRIIDLYKAPEGFKIKNVIKKEFKSQLFGLNGSGNPHKQILTKNDDIWESPLTVIIDGPTNEDHRYVGLYGKMRFYVELQENSWVEQPKQYSATLSE